MKQLKRLIVLLGTRPDAIKMAPVILELRRQPQYEILVVSTGQHREMMSPILEFFGIQPDIDLNLMRPGQSLVDLSAAILSGLERTLGAQKIDGLFVQGDTSSCTAASLWGFLHRVPIFHIEAGLRTSDLMSPWPEEFNRRVTALAATLHFAPTSRSAFNLVQEGHSRDRVHVVGNTVIDALMQVATKLDQCSVLQKQMDELFPFLNKDKKLVLATVHRRESFGDSLKQIFRALRNLSDRNDVQVVLPLHLNPAVRLAASEILVGTRIHLLDPQAYVPFIALMKRSDLILSDSGGVQEEAPALGKPVLVLRNTTERPESVEAGTCLLVGTKTDAILKAAYGILDNAKEFKSMRTVKYPYGFGDSSQKIVTLVNQFFMPEQTVLENYSAGVAPTQVASL